jgi:hypothetical protein
MPSPTLRKEMLISYLLLMVTRNLYTPPPDFQTTCQQFDFDVQFLLLILGTRYINGHRHNVLKFGNLHLAWEFARDPADHHRFISILRVTPQVFFVILSLIEDHPVFSNDSNHGQTSVETQLAVTLYRMGCYGNGASVEEVARMAGCSEGSVENYTERCLLAIEGLHNLFVRKLTNQEKEIEKEWLDENLGFRGLWREGYLMYDGTIVVLYRKPGLNGDAYYTRKSNYGLNVQVRIPSFSFFSFLELTG